jgi:hypothetical protein
MDISISDIQVNTNPLLSSIKLNQEASQRAVVQDGSEQVIQYIDLPDAIVNNPYNLENQNNKKTKTDEDQLD